MTKSIDLKSVLVGGLLALAVLCVLGAAPRLLSGEAVGRFTIVTHAGDPYVLDTATGQVWPKSSSGRSLEAAFCAPKLNTHESQTPSRSNPQ